MRVKHNFVEKCRLILKDIGIEKITIFGIISIIACMILSGLVSDFIFKYVVYYEKIYIGNVSLLNENSNNYPKIWDNRYIDEENVITENFVSEKKYGYFTFDQIENSIVESNKIETGIDIENSYGYIELKDLESYVVLELPVYPNTCITLSTDNNRYAVLVKNGENGYERIISYENSTSANSIKIYLFDIKDYIYIFVAYICIYLLLFIVFLCVCIFLSKLRLNYGWGRTSKYRNLLVCGYIFLFYILFTGLTYYFNAEKLQVGEGADAYYYMNPVLFDEEGKFSLKAIADYLYTFRGYFPILVAVATNGLESLFGIDRMYFYFILYGILSAFTIGIAMPKLSEYFIDSKSTGYMSMAMFLLFFFFWNQHFYYAMTDIPAAMFALSATAYILYGIQENNVKDIVLSGIFWGISISYRTAYTYIFVAILIWCLAIEVLRIKRKQTRLKKAFQLMIGLFLGVLVITFPQFLINYQRGHIGFFPYDGGWKFDVNSSSTVKLAWDSFTSGLHQYGLYSPSVFDKQLVAIDQIFYGQKVYSLGDLMYLVLSNPIEFILGYAKRLFWAMSAGIETIYYSISYPAWLSTVAIIANYVIIWKFGGVFFDNEKKNFLKTKDKILLVLITIASIGVQGLTHIERRYYLYYYLLMYFFVAFLLGRANLPDIKIGTKYNLRRFLLLLLFVLNCFIWNRTIFYNFL